METAQAIKQIYEEASQDQPFRKRKKHTTTFLERFKVGEVQHISETKQNKKLDFDKLDERLNQIATHCKKYEKNTGDFLGYVVSLGEYIKKNEHCDLYIDPEQNELF